MTISKVRSSESVGLFHGSRGDVNKLAKKLNECINVINRQECKIEELSTELKELEKCKGGDE